MTDPIIRNISPKKILFLSSGIIFLFIVLWGFRGYQQNSLGLSGDVVASSPPSLSLSTYGSPMGVSAKNYEMADSVSGYNSRSSTMPNPTLSANAPAGVSKIIKTGTLSLLVKDVDETAVAINSLRTQVSGQPGNSTFSEYGNGGKQGDITLWVPSDQFDLVMLSIKSLAIRVNSEQVNVEDVSAQFVDLEARLRNLKSTEAQYQEIMKRSGKISEVLDVTRALNDTRSQIEQAQGRMDYLSRQVALSSIRVQLTQEAVPGSVIADEWRPVVVMKNALKDSVSDLTHFADLLIVLLVRLPVILLYSGLWILGIIICWKIIWFVYRKLKKETYTAL